MYQHVDMRDSSLLKGKILIKGNVQQSQISCGIRRIKRGECFIEFGFFLNCLVCL